MLNPLSQENFQVLTSRDVSGIIQRGGTFLMTARCKEFLDEKNQQKAVENMRSLGVEGLVCIGGDGTFHGAAALKRLGFPVVGIPGTIDNDLTYTDYTIGFDTALDTAIESISINCLLSHIPAMMIIWWRSAGQLRRSAKQPCCFAIYSLQ